MSEAGARGLASLILNGIALIVKVFREDKRRVVPTDEEKRELAEAIREVCRRRASWMGAIDDIVSFFSATARYTGRAWSAPSAAPKAAATDAA